MSYLLSDLGIKINNDPVAIVPNSLKLKIGIGEGISEVESLGGLSTLLSTGIDVSTLKGEVSFEVRTKNTIFNDVKKWRANRDQNLVLAFNDTISLAFQNAFLMNEPEINIGVDGTTELTFSSLPSL